MSGAENHEAAQIYLYNFSFFIKKEKAVDTNTNLKFLFYPKQQLLLKNNYEA